MGIYFFYLFLIVAGSLIHLWRRPQLRTSNGVAETFLFYFIVIGIGIIGVAAFVAHAFFGPDIAKEIGFPAHNPFQFEVAVSDLAFGVLGVLCIWIRGNFWAATVIGASIFLLGDAYGHINEWVAHNNTQPGNIGGPLYADIVIPVASLILLAYVRKSHSKSADTQKLALTH